jgi:hypothetical protein
MYSKVTTAFVKIVAALHWNVTTVTTYHTGRELECVLVDMAMLPLLHMCLLVMVSSRAHGVNVEVLGVGVFKGHKLADFLSFREWP